MKALKTIGIILLVIIILFLVIGIFLPSDIYMEGKTVINAPASTVFKQVNTMSNWDNWTPFTEDDPDMVITYEGPKTGVGAMQKWISKGDSGTLSIIESVPYEKITTQIDFMNNCSSNGRWTFTQAEIGTEVTWGIDIKGLSYPFGRYLGLFMKGMMKPYFERGLKNMKEYTEDQPPLPEISEFYFEAQPSLTIFDSISFQDMSIKMNEYYTELMTYVQKKNLQMTGAPFTQYYSWDTALQTMTLRAGIPVAQEVDGKGRIEFYVLGPANTVMAVHKGNYTSLQDTYNALDEYILEFGKKIVGGPWEVYLTDPSTDPDTANWTTNVYFPVE